MSWCGGMGASGAGSMPAPPLLRRRKAAVPGPLAPDMTGAMADVDWRYAAFFCRRLRLAGMGGDGVAGSTKSEPEKVIAELLGSMDCVRPAMRSWRRPEDGADWGPEGEGRADAAEEVGCLGSGSGAQVSIGRWSDGSTSRPSCVMILPVASW